jgi:hypothetical protein
VVEGPEERRVLASRRLVVADRTHDRDVAAEDAGAGGEQDEQGSTAHEGEADNDAQAAQDEEGDERDGGEQLRQSREADRPTRSCG